MDTNDNRTNAFLPARTNWIQIARGNAFIAVFLTGCDAVCIGKYASVFYRTTVS